MDWRLVALFLVSGAILSGLGLVLFRDIRRNGYPDPDPALFTDAPGERDTYALQHFMAALLCCFAGVALLALGVYAGVFL